LNKILFGALRGLLRVYFRRIEVVGIDQVPMTGPAVFAPNHPNSLLDPLVLFSGAPRAVATLAAEPLFRKPVLGSVMRSIGAIPVYRREDGADRSRNRSTFDAARAHLAGGGALAIFPEGVSHDDPLLRPIRTGAARITLGVQGVETVSIVPTGLFYTARARFRSSVLICFGPPILVRPAPLDATGEPPADRVQSLTAELEQALGRLVLQAEERRALEMVEVAERIFTTAAAEPADLRVTLLRRRRFVREYTRLRDLDPARVRDLERRVRRYQRWLRTTGLDAEHLPPAGYRPGPVAGRMAVALVALLVLLPVALIGIAIHAPAWHLTRALARRMHARSGRGEDVLGTMKLSVGLVLYPLTWGLLATAGWLIAGLRGALIIGLAGPLTGLFALRFRYRFGQLTAAIRGALLALFGTRLYRRLLAERQLLRREFERLESRDERAETEAATPP
jgi:1-acyl-sn-glycerol-3-phosphate acyltransferase